MAAYESKPFINENDEKAYRRMKFEQKKKKDKHRSKWNDDDYNEEDERNK